MEKEQTYSDNTQEQQQQLQHSLDWYRARLGMITGSMVGVLMNKTKAGAFYLTAMNYIYEIAAERNLNKKIVDDDDQFTEYLQETDISNAAMQWGTKWEPTARELYIKKYKVIVEETGSVKCPTIPTFASSPDGLVKSENGSTIGCIEIKCPKTMSMFIRYINEIKAGADLFKVNPNYYYQCQSHMMCTNTDFCDFIAFMPYLKRPLYVVRVYKDLAAFTAIETVVGEVEALIKNIPTKY